MSNDHTDNLLKVMDIIKYKGCLIYKENGFYYWHGKPYSSLLKAQQKIDSSRIALLKSINRTKKVKLNNGKRNN